jgi:hypothetical protein
MAPGVQNADQTLAEIRRLVSATSVLPPSLPETANEQTEEMRENLRLTEEKLHELQVSVENLNGRLDRKNALIENLKGQVRSKELCADDPDRDLIVRQLGECKSVEEVETRYHEVKERLRRSYRRDLVEEFAAPDDEPETETPKRRRQVDNNDDEIEWRRQDNEPEEDDPAPSESKRPRFPSAPIPRRSQMVESEFEYQTPQRPARIDERVTDDNMMDRLAELGGVPGK